MSSSDSTSESFSDNNNGSSISFSSLLGDNPHPTTDQTLVVTAQIPVVNIPDSEETESDFDDLSEGGKGVPLPKIYKTFSTEVYTFNSKYISLLTIERFRKSTPVAYLKSDPLVILDPCQKEELICLSNPDQGSSIPFTYMYDTVFCKLHLLLPFSNFGKELLRSLNIPPSQLHPNNWAFDGTPHFPLFWSLEPRRVPTVKFDQLSFEEKIDVAFLRNQAPIDCGFLLENEDLPARLRQSLDKMPPKATVPQVITNEKALRRWLKKAGIDPSAPTSDMQTAIPTNERRKKQKLDASIGNQQMETAGGATPTKATEDVRSASQQTIPPPSDASAGNRPPPQPQSGGSSSGVANQTLIPADKWWCLFNNFQGAEGSDVSSIFDHRFPIEQVVSREFSKKDDNIARVNKVGMRNVGKHLMTMGMQTSFFGYCFNSALTVYDKELKEWSLMIQDLTSKLRATESATQTIASLEKSLLDTKTKLAAAETTKTIADAKYSDLVAEQVKLKKDFDDIVLEKDKLVQNLAEATEKISILQGAWMPCRKRLPFFM
ncbi:hypothetical protein SESBI_01726 [Sesbania bispinosa]|nr:hypothetical protein SESBI_01726 [Sesbania bispinosa]